MRLRFVTGNPGKVREARTALAAFGFQVVAARLALVEIQADSLAEVARAKAVSARGRVPLPFFVEDAGLRVEALGGFPGAYSAYAYRTLGCSGLLRLLGGERNRRATFEAVVALMEGRRPPRLFRGRVEGRIAHAERGRQGFGFDPVFIPRGQAATFAEMGPAEKSRLSHRGRALAALGRALARVPARRS